MDDLVPRKTLVKQGTQGIGGIVGGTALLILAGFGTVGSLIVGGAITLIGLAISTSKDDRTAGIVTAVAGGLALISAIPALGSLAAGLLRFSGIGLLIAGGFKLFKFIRGYRSRG